MLCLQSTGYQGKYSALLRQCIGIKWWKEIGKCPLVNGMFCPRNLDWQVLLNIQEKNISVRDCWEEMLEKLIDQLKSVLRENHLNSH